MNPVTGSLQPNNTLNCELPIGDGTDEVMVALGAAKSTVRTATDEVAKFPAPSKTRIAKLTDPDGISACSA